MGDPRSQDAPGFRPMDRAAVAAHDRAFAANYVTIAGRALPMSRTLARMQGYEVDRQPYEAGDAGQRDD